MCVSSSLRHLRKLSCSRKAAWWVETPIKGQKAYTSQSYGYANRVAARYNGSTVLTFVDGHASALTGGSIVDPNTGKAYFAPYPRPFPSGATQVYWSMLPTVSPNRFRRAAPASRNEAELPAKLTSVWVINRQPLVDALRFFELSLVVIAQDDEPIIFVTRPPPAGQQGSGVGSQGLQ